MVQSSSHFSSLYSILHPYRVCRQESSAKRLDQLAKPTFHSRYAHTPFGSAPVPFKLEINYNFGSVVKERVSTIRHFDWSREYIRHAGITLAFVGLSAPT